MRHQGNEPDDETAVRLVLAGRREMFVPLLRRHYAGTLGLCRSILGSETEAQDVVQEAVLQAFLNLERLREPCRFGAWLRSIAANLARSTLRRRRRVLSLESLGEEQWTRLPLADASPTPEEVRLARELHDEILEALGRISTVNREAMVGYYLEGYSYAELAELLNVPVSTVKGRLHKGRRQLAPSLGPVAREVLDADHDQKEVHVDTQGAIEVTVDDVVKVGLKDERWTKQLRSAGSMNELYERWYERWTELSRAGGPMDELRAALDADVLARHQLPRAGGPMDELRGLLEPFFAHESAPAVVVLREADGERVLPIWTGFEAGLSIWLSVSGRQTPGPLTHDLMRQLMETVGLQVRNVAVNRLAEGAFYGEISLSSGEQSYLVDARPGDAIALAVRLGAPIHVARSVFEEASHESKQAWLDQHRQELGLDGER